jgi:hypothetical protein
MEQIGSPQRAFLLDILGEQMVNCHIDLWAEVCPGRVSLTKEAASYLAANS